MDMKRICSIVLMAVMLLNIVQVGSFIAAEAAEAPGYPVLPWDGQSDYVVYQNNDTGGIELALIHSDMEYSLMLERTEQLGGRSKDIGSNLTESTEAVPIIERPRLYFSTETFEKENNGSFVQTNVSEFYLSRWILEEGSWISNGEEMASTICENTGDVLGTNLPVIEVFRQKPYYYNFKHQVYDGREYYHRYYDYSGDKAIQKIEFSADGINYETRIELPVDDDYPIRQVVYGNGVYILEADDTMGVDNWPEWRRGGGYNNRRIYTYGEDNELKHITELSTVRLCTGFVDGYFYFTDKEYLDIPYEIRFSGNFYEQTIDRYYKSVDGIDYIEISEEEYKAAEERIDKQNDQTVGGYSPISVRTTMKDPIQFLLREENGDERYRIVYERPGSGFSANVTGSRDFVTVLFADDENGEEAKNKYLTLDGVYGIPLPYYDYSVTFRWSANSIWTTESDIYIYIYDLSSYFRISKKYLDELPIVRLNNTVLGFSTPPVMEEDRMLVPMRFLFEQMGAEVNWDENTQTATATVPLSADAQLRTFGAETAKSVTFAIDNTTATVNGSTAEMDVPARLVNDKTMVPLRFLSENLGCTVDWDEATNTAIITTNN